MNILNKIKKAFTTPPTKLERALYLYVQCEKCGEKIMTRVDIWNDLTPEYEGRSDSPASYHCRKVLIGVNKCYQPIELMLEFDRNHKLVNKQIKGGKLIEEEEFENQTS